MYPISGVNAVVPGYENRPVRRGPSIAPNFQGMQPTSILASFDHEEATMYELSEDAAVSLGFRYLEDLSGDGAKLYIVEEYAKYQLIQDPEYPNLYHKYGVAMRMVLSAVSDDRKAKLTFAGLFTLMQAKKSRLSVKCRYEAIGFGGPALTKIFPMPSIVKDVDGLRSEKDYFGVACRALYEICDLQKGALTPGSWIKPQEIGVVDLSPPKETPKPKGN